MIERRSTTGTAAAVRLAAATGKLTGYASVFYKPGQPGTQYKLWDGAVERIAPTAFDKALQRRDDAAALFNHNADNLLGRVSSGTLLLTVDSRGLRYDITPPDTHLGNDVVELTRRGDLRGSSFAFVIDNESWHREGTLEVRTVTDLKLYDVGPVTFPAYAGASVGLGDRADRPAELARVHATYDAACCLAAMNP
jgi:HK97 family phage prohead protease